MVRFLRKKSNVFTPCCPDPLVSLQALEEETSWQIKKSGRIGGYAMISGLVKSIESWRLVRGPVSGSDAHPEKLGV